MEVIIKWVNDRSGNNGGGTPPRGQNPAISSAGGFCCVSFFLFPGGSFYCSGPVPASPVNGNRGDVTRVGGRITLLVHGGLSSRSHVDWWRGQQPSENNWTLGGTGEVGRRGSGHRQGRAPRPFLFLLGTPEAISQPPLELGCESVTWDRSNPSPKRLSNSS